MSKKTFTAAPRPAKPTDDQILAFERGGAGHDTRTPPDASPRAASADAKLKRLSIDLPDHVHARFKAACSAAGKKMGDELKSYIERRTLELEEDSGIRRKST